jgi:hypothetical protein
LDTKTTCQFITLLRYQNHLTIHCATWIPKTHTPPKTTAGTQQRALVQNYSARPTLHHDVPPTPVDVAIRFPNSRLAGRACSPWQGILQSHSRLVQAQQRTPQEERLIPAAPWLVAAAMLGALLVYAVVSVGVPAKVARGSSGGANSDGRVEALRIAAADGTEAPLSQLMQATVPTEWPTCQACTPTTPLGTCHAEREKQRTLHQSTK